MIQVIRAMTIRRQFTVIVAAFSLAMPAGVFGVAWMFNRNLSETRRFAVEDNQQGAAIFSLIGALDDVQAGILRLIREKDPDRIEELMDRGKKYEAGASEAIAKAGDASGRLKTAFETLLAANRKCVDAILRGDNAAANQSFIEESNPAFNQIVQIVGDLNAAMVQRQTVRAADQERLTNRSRNLALFITLAVMTTLIALSILLVKNTNSTLHQALGQLHILIATTNSTARRITSSADQLASGAAAQAAAIQQTSASSEEINSMTERNAEHAQLAADKMNTAAQQISEANRRLGQLVASMTAITASSDKVSRIIRTIDEIAFQTNILALNAAVEAARAGEAGLGFAVVADEVRNLAQRCAEAARDTTSLIEDSLGKTRTGKGDVDSVTATVSSLTESATGANSLIDEIRAASQEQARGIHQISQALIQLQNETQKIAGAAEDGAHAGQTLSGQIPSIDNVLSRLRALVE
jgi:methyl-accepting chemotaxis protein